MILVTIIGNPPYKYPRQMIDENIMWKLEDFNVN
jgi:hypothetical protein